MNDRGRRIAGRVAAAMLACLLPAGLPVLAASRSVVLSGGSTLTVWEQHGRAVAGQGPASWSIRFTLTDGVATTQGVVPPTGDTARDSAPFLAIDETGSAVVVWSRFDGSYRKIAYARFSGGGWTDFTWLTFGPGDDDEPRLGTGLTGSFLFFMTGNGKYQFAPLDLRTGRLFAAPRPLALGSARRAIELGSGPSTQAGVDVPVTGQKPPDKPGRNGGILLPGTPTVQGGVDAPITGAVHKAYIWSVGSSEDCTRMVLSIPSRDLKSVYLFRFTVGANSLLHRHDLPGQVAEKYGEELAAANLPYLCN